MTSSFLSWWVVALIIGGTSPLWVKALADHWEKKTRERTQRLLDRASAEQRSEPYRTRG